MRFISRHDTRAHGWQVRCPVKDNTPKARLHTRFFSDRAYGGKQASLKAAAAYRDAFLAKTNQTYKLRRRKRLRTVTSHSRNTSGIIGVRLALEVKHTSTGEHVYEAWVGYGLLNGKIWRKQFSCLKYGYREAFLLACQERYHRNGPLRVTAPLKHLPCKPNVPFFHSPQP